MACNTITSLRLDHNKCVIQWGDAHISRFHAKWLRFNCRCVKCKAPYPGIYTIDVAAFPADLTLTQAKTNETGSVLQTSYSGDVLTAHVAIHPVDWLRAKCYCDQCLQRKIRQRDVITRNIADPKRKRVVRQVEFAELESDQGLFKMLENVVESGLCLVKNVPTESETVLKVARMVGFVEPSTYGEKFDVFVRKAENAAYTDLKLPFHQDQVYYENGPGIQMLHAIAFDKCVSGGDSMFVDLFEAVAILRRESPEDFKALLEVPGTYDTIDPTVERFYEHQKHIVNIGYAGEIIGVSWHPGLMAVPQIREQDVDRFYAAHSAMLKVIRRKELEFRFKLEQGDLIVFNNRRMLHAREAYETNGGNRHLQGTYLKLGDWRSKYMALAGRLGKCVEPPKMGNNSSF